MMPLNTRTETRLARTVEMMQDAQADGSRDLLLQQVHCDMLLWQLWAKRLAETAPPPRPHRDIAASTWGYTNQKLHRWFVRIGLTAALAGLAFGWLACAAWEVQVCERDSASGDGAAIHGLVASPESHSGTESSAASESIDPLRCMAAIRSGAYYGEGSVPEMTDAGTVTADRAQAERRVAA